MYHEGLSKLLLGKVKIVVRECQNCNLGLLNLSLRSVKIAIWDFQIFLGSGKFAIRDIKIVILECCNCRQGIVKIFVRECQKLGKGLKKLLRKIVKICG